MSSDSEIAGHGGARNGATACLMRPLGAWERMYHRYMERNPMHFVMSMEFEVLLSHDQVQKAIDAVQARHPLLSVHLENPVGSPLGFYRSPRVPAIPVAGLRQDPQHWQPVAARELSRPFDRSVAPLLRCNLISDEKASTILLSFDHTVSDGISATLILKDLVKALNGHQLNPLPVPPSQEELIAKNLPSLDELQLGAPQAEDPRATAPGVLRPFDGALPHVHTVTLDSVSTARLLQRCRDEKTTMQGAIVGAAARVRSTLRGEDFVRVLSPFDFRELIGGSGVANYFAARRIGIAPHDGTGLWEQARFVRAQLRDFTSIAGVVGISAAVQQFIPVDADAQTAENFLASSSAYELAVSNLGVIDFDSSALIRPSAVSGPITLFQSEGEMVMGVITYNGQLGMTACAYAPTDIFLDQVRTMLSEA
jgi:NRPS condensation-like uncharacterized protein